MFFEDGKSNFSFLINGYLEREADFFPNEETRLNTYDSCIWYSPDGSEDNALIWPGIYQTPPKPMKWVLVHAFQRRVRRFIQTVCKKTVCFLRKKGAVRTGNVDSLWVK